MIRLLDRLGRWLGIAVLVALALALLGCQPPVPGRHLVVGDSLTMTAALEGGFPAGYDVHSMMGWEAEDALPGVTQRVADPARNPACAAVALGHNDAADGMSGSTDLGDGFTATDQRQLTDLADAFHPATEVVWVLPAYHGNLAPYAAGIAAYRGWVTAEAAEAGDRVIDWATVVQPAHLEPDGTHLTPAGRRAYGAFIAQGLGSCD